MNFPFNRCKRPIFTRYMDYMMSSICPLFFCGGIWGVTKLIQHPIPSRYDIFTYSWLIFVVNARKYTIHWSYLPLWLHQKKRQELAFCEDHDIAISATGTYWKTWKRWVGFEFKRSWRRKQPTNNISASHVFSKLSNFDVLNCPQRKKIVVLCFIIHLYYMVFKVSPKDLGPSNGRVWTCIAGVGSSK